MSHACWMPCVSMCARKACGSATKPCICAKVGFEAMTARAAGVMRSKRLTCTWPSMTGMPAWRHFMMHLLLVQEGLDAVPRGVAAVQTHEFLDLELQPFVVR